jgi:hypothetical protein
LQDFSWDKIKEREKYHKLFEMTTEYSSAVNGPNGHKIDQHLPSQDLPKSGFLV